MDSAEEQKPDGAAALVALSVREREVLRALLRHGYAKAVANELGLSTRTVENHLAKARAKLGVESTLQAASLLREFDARGEPPPTADEDPLPVVQRSRRRVGLLVLPLAIVILAVAAWTVHILLLGPVMPDLIGLKWDKSDPRIASVLARAKEVPVGPAGYDPTERRSNYVLDQFPQPGEPRKPGTPETIWTGFEAVPKDFDDRFKDGRLCSDWTTAHDVGTVPVVGPPYRLRYVLDGDTGSGGDARATHLSRPLFGRHWWLETKVRYHLPPGYGRQLYLRIVFGAPDCPTACFAEWWRNSDHASREKDNERIEFNDVGFPSSVSPVGLDDPCVVRFTRDDQRMTLTVTPEGGSPVSRTYRFNQRLPAIQHLVLTGASYLNTNGWAEYDHFTFRSLDVPSGK